VATPCIRIDTEEEGHLQKPLIKGARKIRHCWSFFTYGTCKLGEECKFPHLTKEELIALLTMKELPEAMRVEKMTIHQLRAEAKKRNIAGLWTLRRGALVDLLFPQSQNVNETAPHQYEQDESETNKHHQPEEHDTEEVGVKNV
jgi:hypothetical protein